MWIERKVFPQSLCFNRIFYVSSRLHLFLFLMLGSREKCYCSCSWPYGRCPYVHCIGLSSASGVFSRRWCPIFSLTLCYHDVVSPQELMAGVMFCLVLLQSPDNPLISISYFQQPQDIKRIFLPKKCTNHGNEPGVSGYVYAAHTSLEYKDTKLPNRQGV